MGAVSTNSDYRFDVQLAEGLAVEGWFYEMTRGGDRFEVKHDRKALTTHRVYVEYEHDPGRTGSYKPCGIETTEADCWIFALGEPPHAFIGVSTERLRRLCVAARYRGKVREQRFGSCPTKGAVVSLADLLDIKRAA